MVRSDFILYLCAALSEAFFRADGLYYYFNQQFVGTILCDGKAQSRKQEDKAKGRSLLLIPLKMYATSRAYYENLHLGYYAASHNSVFLEWS